MKKKDFIFWVGMETLTLACSMTRRLSRLEPKCLKKRPFSRRCIIRALFIPLEDMMLMIRFSCRLVSTMMWRRTSGITHHMIIHKVWWSISCIRRDRRAVVVCLITIFYSFLEVIIGVKAL